MRSIWLPSSLSPFFIFFISYRLQTLPLLVELFTREKYLLLLLLLLLSREDYSDARRAAMFISDRQFFFFPSYGEIRAYNWRGRGDGEREGWWWWGSLISASAPPPHSPPCTPESLGCCFVVTPPTTRRIFPTSPLQHRCLRVWVSTHTD